jgi:hypothetical protein
VKVDLNSLARKAVEILDRHVMGYQGPLIEAVEPVFFTDGTSLGHANAMQRSKNK